MNDAYSESSLFAMINYDNAFQILCLCSGINYENLTFASSQEISFTIEKWFIGAFAGTNTAIVSENPIWSYFVNSREGATRE